MKCPRCGDADMFEKDRDGITIDVCPGCRGVFLDRGELEKLVAFAANDDAPPSSGPGRTRHGGHRREGFLSRLGDFFD